MDAPLLPPNPHCISFHPDNGLQISPPLRVKPSFPGEKLSDIFLAFILQPQPTTSYCSFFFPSITDEVTIYSIRFFVLELMELLLHFWRINILALLVPLF